MKKLLLLVAACIGLSFSAKALPPCITNVTVTFNVGVHQYCFCELPGTYDATFGSNPNHTEIQNGFQGMGLIGDDCDHGPVFEVNFPCCLGFPTPQVVATVSWQCNMDSSSECKFPGGSFNIRIPDGSSGCQFRIFPKPNGDGCELSRCIHYNSVCQE